MTIATVLIIAALILGIAQFVRSQASDFSAIAVVLLASALLLAHYA